jgi:hypothetical protein
MVLRMAEDRPMWRQGFDTVEQAVAPRLTEVVNSEQFAIAAGIVTRAQRTARRSAERTTRRLLHLANLPAGSDVTRLLNEIGALQAQVRELSRQVERSAAEGRPERDGEAHDGEARDGGAKHGGGGGADGGATGLDRPARTRPARR